MKILLICYDILLYVLIKIKKFTFTSPPSHPTPGSIRSVEWGNADEDSREIPLVIWTYWSGKRSPCAEACFSSLKAHNPLFTIIAINDQNLQDYLPGFPTLPQNLPIQLKSDMIRLSLLEKYGGIWIDSSVVVTCSLNWILESAHKNRAELVCFYNEHPRVYRSDYSRPVIENGFIATVKGSIFICDWLKNYKACILSENWKTYYKLKSDYSSLIANFINPNENSVSYFSCYMAAQQTMMNSKNYRLHLLNAEDDYYFYLYNTKSITSKVTMCELILVSNQPMIYPKLIKLPKRHREITDKFIEYGHVNYSSILGRYVSR